MKDGDPSHGGLRGFFERAVARAQQHARRGGRDAARRDDAPRGDDGEDWTPRTGPAWGEYPNRVYPPTRGETVNASRGHDPWTERPDRDGAPWGAGNGAGRERRRGGF